MMQQQKKKKKKITKTVIIILIDLPVSNPTTEVWVDLKRHR